MHGAMTSDAGHHWQVKSSCDRECDTEVQGLIYSPSLKDIFSEIVRKIMRFYGYQPKMCDVFLRGFTVV